MFHFLKALQMNAIISLLKFSAGFVSNFICQLIRATANGILCVLMAASCLITAILGLLQFAGGGKEIGEKTAKKALLYAKSSAISFAYFFCQLIATSSLVGPLVRGAQACSEKMTPEGIYAPTGPNRTLWQIMLGLNSWERKCDQQKAAPIVVTPPQQNKKALAQKQIAKTIRPSKPKKEDWNFLVEKYISSRTIEESTKVREKMAIRYPSKYKKALSWASASSKRRPA